jgi:hypothetical protein
MASGDALMGSWILQQIIERGSRWAGAILAMAAQISGYTNTAIAIVLLWIAAVFVVIPAWHHARVWYRQRKEMGRSVRIAPLIVGGIGGIFIFGLFDLGQVAWQFYHPSEDLGLREQLDKANQEITRLRAIQVPRVATADQTPKSIDAKAAPNIRLANNPSILKLFEGEHLHEVMALLTTGQLAAWGRSSFSSRSRDLTPINSALWKIYHFASFPKNIDGTTPQTYLTDTTYNRSSAMYYDLYLSSEQMKSVLAKNNTGIKLSEVIFIFDTSEEPIIWRSPFITYGGTNEPNVYMANGFSVSGINESDKEVALEKAQIISGITGKALDLKVEIMGLGGRVSGLSITEINPVPPKAEIRLAAQFSKDGISEKKFLDEWGKLFLSITYGGKEQRYQFNESVIHDLLNQWGTRQMDQTARPRITPRADDVGK